jgi:uncharacterized protein YhjY with autotransporter beta-barrel domain
MNTGIVKSKASGLALMGKVLVAGVMMGAAPQHAIATSQDAAFLQYILNTCAAPTAPPSWDLVSLGDLCSAINTGGPAGGVTTPTGVSANLGTANAGSGAVERKKKGMRVSLDEQQSKADKGASADGGGWGLLVTPQYSKSNRPDTDLENGYESKLSGLVIGLDYRFSDRFVLGLALGRTRDKANFASNAGFLDSSNSTATLYGTWLYSDSVAVDGYIGAGKLKFDNQRQVVSGSNITGTISGNTTGNQTMAGVSASYQAYMGKFSLAPFFNLDYVKTRIDGYDEAGDNYNVDLVALHYGDRSVTSLTSGLGARLSTSHNHEWGALLPSARLAFVHEFQNKTRQISNELIITPGASFLVETDEPDRNYLNLGLGLAAAFNSGTQLFLDFEKRTQDKLLSSWAVSVGGLFEF